LSPWIVEIGHNSTEDEIFCQFPVGMRASDASLEAAFRKYQVLPISELQARVGEFRRGWPAVLACLIGNTIGLHTLPPYTIGLFIAPLQHEFGWSRISISLGITIITIGTAISSPAIGVIVDRVGERRLIATGMLMLACGYCALSSMNGSIGGYWTIMALMALFGSGCAPVTLSRIIVTLFDRDRGAALGIALIGTGLAGALAPVVIAPIIAGQGWRAGYLALAAVMLALLPIAFGLLLFNGTGEPRVSPVQEHSRVSIAEAIKQPLFLRLLVLFFLIALGAGGVVVHFVPMLADAGYQPSHAAYFASMLGLSLVSGRLLTGFAVDRIFAPKVAMILMAGSAAGFAVLAVHGQEFLPYAAILVGMSLGAEIDLIAYLSSRYFAPRLFGCVFSLLYSGFLVGVALSPLVYAGLHDCIGSYAPGFIWTAVLLALSAVIFATLPRFVSRRAVDVA